MSSEGVELKQYSLLNKPIQDLGLPSGGKPLAIHMIDGELVLHVLEEGQCLDTDTYRIYLSESEDVEESFDLDDPDEVNYLGPVIMGNALMYAYHELLETEEDNEEDEETDTEEDTVVEF